MRWLDLFRKRLAVLLSAGFILASASASHADMTVNTTDGVNPVYGAWSVDGGVTWNASGATVVSAAATYNITFGDIPGYTKPADQNNVAGPGPATGVYTIIANPGIGGFGGNTVTVNIYPAQAVTDGAQWSLDGGATWNNSGSSVSTSSSYTVTYKTTAGWRKPLSVSGTATSPTITGVYRHVVTDFNKDAKSEALFRNGTTGHLYEWTMSGATVSSGGYTSASPGTGAAPGTIVGQGDFNGDGRTDLLFENTSTKDLTVWIMNGTTVVSTSNLMTVTTPITRTATEVVAGVADFSGDGKDDILILETASAGNLQGRLVSNVHWANLTSTNLSTSISQTSASYGTHTGWHVAALDDFDADGKADILWRFANQTSAGGWSAGQTSIWYMSGATRSSGGQLPIQLGAYQNTTGGATPTGWLVVGTGDFNGDGYTDILYRYAGGGSVTTGTTAIWLLQGQSNGTPVRVDTGVDTDPVASRGSGKTLDSNSVILNAGAFTSTSGWNVAGVGDHNGDGKDDILWRYTGTGHTYVWTMNGRTATSAGFTTIYPGTADGTGWNASVMRTIFDPQ